MFRILVLWDGGVGGRTLIGIGDGEVRKSSGVGGGGSGGRVIIGATFVFCVVVVWMVECVLGVGGRICVGSDGGGGGVYEMTGGGGGRTWGVGG